MRPRRLSANEIFWLEVDEVVARAALAGGFSLEDYQKIIYELRRRYNVATLHSVEVLKRLEARPNFPTIASVFALEDVFFQKDGTVTSEQHEELMTSLKLLIPRT
jgi:hypothetical protein